MDTTLRLGIVGAGKISEQYSDSFLRLPQVTVAAVADLDGRRAAALADRHGARATTVDRLMDADDVDAVVNLTIPAAHAEVARTAIAAGKHVYGEKPLTTTTDEAVAVVRAAQDAGVRLACAPDTVLGTGIQTARAAVDSGAVGVPHAATAFMVTPGHERWHWDPEFYYRPGGGPLLDMGPYYLTSLVHLLGPVRRVVGGSSRPRATRVVGAGPRAGTTVDVTIDTHVTGILEHDSGALTTLMMSFDTWAAHLPRIEVYGSAGSLSVPDPNLFDGAVRLYTAEAPQWVDLPPSAGYVGAGRGYGVADLAVSLDAGGSHRASVEVALHVLDVMESVQAAADAGTWVSLTTTCERPSPVAGLVDLAGASGPRP